MSVKSIDKNYDNLTITALAEFEAAPETLTARESGTAAEVVTAFADRPQMEELISMGAVEGAEAAVSRMDALLAAG